jgi:integrase
MHLNDRNAAAAVLPKGKAEAIIFDDDIPGFGVRIRGAGSRTWIFQYKIGPRHRRVTLGRISALPAVRAREIASELAAKVRLGGDPANDKAAARQVAGDTLAAALATYLPEKADAVRPATLVAITRHLQKHCRSLHRLPLTAIDRRTIAVALNSIAVKSGPIEANRVRSSLSGFFIWAMMQGLLDSNPVAGTQSRPEKSRERVLSIDELRRIWDACDRDDDEISAITRLLILTAQRGGEIGGLRWDEIEGDRILLPLERVKNKREHLVPLSTAARAILDQRPRRGEYVFGRFGDGPFRGWSRGKAAIDARLDAVGAELKSWTLHDLRRSAATHMAEQGLAPPHVIEAVLNHAKPGVGGIYNRATYANEKRVALQKWSDYLAGKLIGNIVALHA